MPGLTQVTHHQVQQQQHQQQQQQQQSVGATQTQTLVIKSNHHAVVTLPAGLVSSAPAGIVTMTKTINQVSTIKSTKLQIHSTRHSQGAVSVSHLLCLIYVQWLHLYHTHTHTHTNTL